MPGARRVFPRPVTPANPVRTLQLSSHPQALHDVLRIPDPDATGTRPADLSALSVAGCPRRRKSTAEADRGRRIYREEGLALRRKRRRKSAAGIRIVMPPPERPNRRWSMDFVTDSVVTGRRFRAPASVDDYSRACQAIKMDTSIRGAKVISVLDRLANTRGLLEVITVDNGLEFVSRALDEWAYRNTVKLSFIHPGKPIENPFAESFNGRLAWHLNNTRNWPDNTKTWLALRTLGRSRSAIAGKKSSGSCDDNRHQRGFGVRSERWPYCPLGRTRNVVLLQKTAGSESRTRKWPPGGCLHFSLPAPNRSSYGAGANHAVARDGIDAYESPPLYLEPSLLFYIPVFISTSLHNSILCTGKLFAHHRFFHHIWAK
jgi:transposase InsO family protein